MAAAGAALIMTACQSAGTQQYTVMGNSSEVSRVTSEEYTPFFATQQAALMADEENASVSDTEASAAEDSSEGSVEETQRRTMSDDVNLREEPEDGTILEIIPKGATVELLSDDEDGWYQVRYQGITGYVKEGYFQEDKDREEAASKKAEEEQQAQEESQKEKEEEEARQKAVDAAIRRQQEGQDAGTDSEASENSEDAADSENSED